MKCAHKEKKGLGKPDYSLASSLLSLYDGTQSHSHTHRGIVNGNELCACQETEKTKVEMYNILACSEFKMYVYMH